MAILAEESRLEALSFSNGSLIRSSDASQIHATQIFAHAATPRMMFGAYTFEAITRRHWPANVERITVIRTHLFNDNPDRAQLFIEAEFHNAELEVSLWESFEASSDRNARIWDYRVDDPRGMKDVEIPPGFSYLEIDLIIPTGQDGLLESLAGFIMPANPRSLSGLSPGRTDPPPEPLEGPRIQVWRPKTSYEITDPIAFTVVPVADLDLGSLTVRAGSRLGPLVSDGRLSPGVTLTQDGANFLVYHPPFEAGVNLRVEVTIRNRAGDRGRGTWQMPIGSVVTFQDRVPPEIMFEGGALLEWLVAGAPVEFRVEDRGVPVSGFNPATLNVYFVRGETREQAIAAGAPVAPFRADIQNKRVRIDLPPGWQPAAGPVDIEVTAGDHAGNTATRTRRVHVQGQRIEPEPNLVIDFASTAAAQGEPIRVRIEDPRQDESSPGLDLASVSVFLALENSTGGQIVAVQGGRAVAPYRVEYRHKGEVTPFQQGDLAPGLLEVSIYRSGPWPSESALVTVAASDSAGRRSASQTRQHEFAATVIVPVDRTAPSIEFAEASGLQALDTPIVLTAVDPGEPATGVDWSTLRVQLTVGAAAVLAVDGGAAQSGFTLAVIGDRAEIRRAEPWPESTRVSISVRLADRAGNLATALNAFDTVAPAPEPDPDPAPDPEPSLTLVADPFWSREWAWVLEPRGIRTAEWGALGVNGSYMRPVAGTTFDSWSGSDGLTVPQAYRSRSSLARGTTEPDFAAPRTLRMLLRPWNSELHRKTIYFVDESGSEIGISTGTYRHLSAYHIAGGQTHELEITDAFHTTGRSWFLIDLVRRRSGSVVALMNGQEFAIPGAPDPVSGLGRLHFMDLFTQGTPINSVILAGTPLELSLAEHTADARALGVLANP